MSKEQDDIHRAFELLKIRLEHQHKMQTAFLTVSSMLLAILGALLKFSIDSADKPIGFLFPAAGALVSAYAFLIGVYAVRVVKRSEQEIALLNEASFAPLRHTDAPALRFTIVCYFVFAAICLLAFAVILASR